MKLTFLGATGTVTGSKYLITTENKKILIDCGLFQGHKELRLRNWHDLPINPSQLDAIILTHAHIDHSGYIPLIIKQGFNGKIYCSHATKDLCAILLPDSGYLQEEEARLANKLGYSKHHPALPLYTREDAENSLAYFHDIDFAKKIGLDEEFNFSLHYAGHILGASFVRVEHHQTSVIFSGDLGRPNDAIMRAPVAPPTSDYLVIESTYGDRLHDKTDPLDNLEAIINTTIANKGIVLIPAFAVGRTQCLLYFLYLLKKNNRIPNIPIYLDSPMAIDATKIFYTYANQHRLTKLETAEVCQSVHYVRTPDESFAMMNYDFPRIIISASGMATGGRILYHLEKFAPEKQNSIIFSGFQAGGTRGDRITQGEKSIKMHGRYIPINANIYALENLSAHADQQELLDWIGKFSKPLRNVFITHGEKNASKTLQECITKKFAWNCTLPNYQDEFELT